MSSVERQPCGALTLGKAVLYLVAPTLSCATLHRFESTWPGAAPADWYCPLAAGNLSWMTAVKWLDPPALEAPDVSGTGASGQTGVRAQAAGSEPSRGVKKEVAKMPGHGPGV